MTATIISSILGVLVLALGIAKYFLVKTPEQIEQEDLDKEKVHADELAKAVTKTETGDPSDLSSILNGK